MKRIGFYPVQPLKKNRFGIRRLFSPSPAIIISSLWLLNMSNIDIDISGNAFEIVQTVYERYLKYYGLSADDKEALTRNKFVRYLRHDYMEINYKQKKINGEPVLCFFNIRLKPDTGQTDTPRPPENDKTIRQDINSGNNNEPPPEEIPF
jgi:hypothetical protein